MFIYDSVFEKFRRKDFGMPRKSSRRQKVSFIATKKVTVGQKVSFRTKKGKNVSFTAHKKVSKPVRITFYTKSKTKK